VNDIHDQAQEVFREVFGDDELTITDETTADHVSGWDSATHIMLIVALEKRFGVRFALAEVSGLKEQGQNVGELLRLIAKKLGKGG
jgi:acyl carrier protein